MKAYFFALLISLTMFKPLFADIKSKTTEITDTPDHVRWFDLFTTDFDQATKFYRALFGWDFQASGYSFNLLIAANGRPFGNLILGQGRSDGLHFEVANISQVYLRAMALGAVSIYEPCTLNNGITSFAKFADPFGNQIAIHGGPVSTSCAFNDTK